MSVTAGTDPRRLDEAGWGVIFASDEDPSIREALGPLLALRQNQAGERFRVYFGQDGYRLSESGSRFLARHGAGAGPADPDKMPYYLLLVGDPGKIPYRFQEELDVQHAVGRLWFDTLDEFHNYANSVVTTEASPPVRQPGVVFFAPGNDDDLHTQRIANTMVQPLATDLKADLDGRGWRISELIGQAATKNHLLELLRQTPPRLLLTAGHGLVYPNGNPMQRSHQGGLVCQDWPGPRKWQQAISTDFCFLADDLSPDLNLSGMISIHYSSYSLGTPGSDTRTQPPAPEPFIARLPQRLLGAKALAAVGLFDRVWAFSSPIEFSSELIVLRSVLRALLEGSPIGLAFEYITERYAELAVTLADTLEEIEFGRAVDAEELTRLWKLQKDARSIAILGDPAARLLIGEVEREVEGYESFSLAEAEVVVPLEMEVPSEIEIRLVRTSMNTYVVELQFSSQNESLMRPPAREEVQFDLSRLRALENRPEAYGSALTESLFVHPRQRLFFEQALSLVRRKQQRLRIRLQIDPGASELHALQWETLRGLEEGGFLTLTEGVYFTRFLTSPTWARLELRPMGDFRALLVFANPAGLTEDRLSNVEQTRSSLGETPVTVLSAQFGNRPASLQNLVKSLSEAYDILYLDCHVAFVQDKPLLWFENDEGGVDVVAGSALVARLSELRWRPRLVVLANGQTEALAVLAPRLAEAGIMAVLAIQGNVGGTLPLFMTTFFKELWLDGQVDRAVAVARTSVGNRSGWWAPVLYQRGRDGKLWDAQK